MTADPSVQLGTLGAIGTTAETSSELWTRKHAGAAATRHLCVGVYLDREFRDFVLKKVHNAARARVAPSYAFDLVPVVRHAWYSWFLDIGHYLAVLGCLLGSWQAGGPVVLLVTVCVIVACAALGFAVRGISLHIRNKAEHFGKELGGRTQPRSRKAPISSQKSEAPSKRTIEWAIVLAIVVALLPIGVAQRIGTRVQIVGAAALWLLGALLVCAFLCGIARHIQLNSLYQERDIRPDKLTRREQILDKQQKAIGVLYQRPGAPERRDPLDRMSRDEKDTLFLGSGKLVNRWLPPMIVPLRNPGGMEYAEAPFRAHELVEKLRSALLQLGADTGTESLAGLTVRDRIYFATSDISAGGVRSLDHPTEREVWAVIDDYRTVGQHFLETTVPIAGGELVTSVLIQVSVKGRTLSLDVATCALTRNPVEYHAMDPFNARGVRAVIRYGMRTAFSLPSYLWRLWRLAEAPLLLARAWWANRERAMGKRGAIRVAGELSVRKEKVDPWDEATLDDQTTIYDRMKIVEERIVKTIENFLRVNGIDASDFAKRATQIINSGILNMGSMDLKNSAVGANNQVGQNAAATEDAN